MPAPEKRYMEASPSVMSTSEKGEFSRLLKAKINELGMSDMIECTYDSPSVWHLFSNLVSKYMVYF